MEGQLPLKLQLYLDASVARNMEFFTEIHNPPKEIQEFSRANDYHPVCGCGGEPNLKHMGPYKSTNLPRKMKIDRREIM